MSLDAYQLLGVKKGDSLNAIKRRYRALLKRYHPDHYPDKMKALYRSNLIIKSFQIISTELESIAFLKKLRHNHYEWRDHRLHLFLRRESSSFFSLFEPINQIYEFAIKRLDLQEYSGGFSVIIHYFRREEGHNLIYRNLNFKRKIQLKHKKRLVIRGEGDLRGQGRRHLVIFLRIV